MYLVYVRKKGTIIFKGLQSLSLVLGCDIDYRPVVSREKKIRIICFVSESLI